MNRFTLPTLGATAAALGVVALTAGAAGAHVTVTPDTTAAGAYAVLTFSVGHGCEGSPTTRLAIKMPESIPEVTPTVNPNWSVKKVDEKLDQPIADAHGNEVTQRTSQVVYTAKQPLTDGYRDTVALSVQLPEQAGETLTFPVVQTCAKGQTAWTETAAEGQDAEELESPAPTITLTEATGDPHGGSSEEATGDKPEADEDDGDNGTALGTAGLVAGVVGIVVGGAALARTRKQS